MHRWELALRSATKSLGKSQLLMQLWRLQGTTPEAQQLMVTHLGRCRQTWSGGEPRSRSKVELSVSLPRHLTKADVGLPETCESQQPPKGKR